MNHLRCAEHTRPRKSPEQEEVVSFRLQHVSCSRELEEDDLSYWFFKKNE